MYQFVADVIAEFYRLCDESDQTFLTTANAQTLLAQAYEQFRDLITEVDPESFMTTADIAVSGTSYDLALAANPVRLMGNPAGGLTGPRLNRLQRVAVISAPGGLPGYFLYAAKGFEDLYNNVDGYILQRTVLQFGGTQTATIRLYYTPYSTVNWATATPTTEWIDDFVQFHDIIAMLAFKKYAVRDWSTSAPLLEELNSRIADLRSFVAEGRAVEASSFIGFRSH